MTMKRLKSLILAVIMCCTMLSGCLTGSVAAVAESSSTVETVNVSLVEKANDIQNVPQYIYVCLSDGASGTCVKTFQKLLISAGYLASGSADGKYGQKTGEAVWAFQSDHGLTTNGIADLITQIALVESLTTIETTKDGVILGKVDGYEAALFPNGELYVGAIKRNGDFSEGQYYQPEKGWYIGSFEGNKRSGDGQARFLDGDIYVGKWKNDMMNGTGTYYFLSYNSIENYTGKWVDNEMSGKGTYVTCKGEVITGTWEHNEHKGW